MSLGLSCAESSLRIWYYSHFCVLHFSIRILILMEESFNPLCMQMFTLLLIPLRFYPPRFIALTTCVPNLLPKVCSSSVQALKMPDPLPVTSYGSAPSSKSSRSSVSLLLYTGSKKLLWITLAFWQKKSSLQTK